MDQKPQGPADAYHPCIHHYSIDLVTNQKVGLASAMAVFLLIIIIIAKFLQDAFFKFVFRNATTDDESYDAKKKKKKAAKLAKAAAQKGGR